MNADNSGLPLWLLRPRVKDYTGDPDPEWEGKRGTDPWEPWYDKAFGFVVAAPDEALARRLANEDAGDENREGYDFDTGKVTPPKYPNVWENPEYSVCWQIAEQSTITEPKVVVRDFAAA